MATTIETLKKPNGDQVLPRTRAKAVSMENGTTVEAAIKDINTTIDGLPGIYVQPTMPTGAVAGDIWIDTTSDPEYVPSQIPEITAADNGKVLMVVNGTLQFVNINLTVDANGVVSI